MRHHKKCPQPPKLNTFVEFAQCKVKKNKSFYLASDISSLVLHLLAQEIIKVCFINKNTKKKN